MKWVHLVEMDEEAVSYLISYPDLTLFYTENSLSLGRGRSGCEIISYSESLSFLVSGIDEEGPGKREFFGFQTLLPLDPPRTFILR